MHEATEHLRALSRRVVDEALERVPLRAALVAGSAARGDADFYSDIDLLLYVDEVPPETVMAEIREAIGGRNPIRKGEPTDHFCGEEFDLQGVRTEVSFLTVARLEWHLDQLLDRLEQFDSPLLESLPLHSEELVERWRARVREYPEPLRRAMVERHWNLFPLWYYREAMAARDAELWRLDMLLEAVFNLLGVLAGLNRQPPPRWSSRASRSRRVGRPPQRPVDSAAPFGQERRAQAARANSAARHLAAARRSRMLDGGAWR